MLTLATATINNKTTKQQQSSKKKKNFDFVFFLRLRGRDNTKN